MKKKESPPTSAIDKKMRQAALAIHFHRYSDSAKGDLPRTFNLKLGLEIVGTASIDWTAVIMVIMDYMIAGQHGSRMSNEEYAKHAEQLSQIFTIDSPDTEKTSILFHRLFHMLAHLPDSLNAALALLFAESARDAEIARGKERGSTDIPSAAKFAKWATKEQREFIMARLPQMRGGNKKTKPTWRDEANLRRYAERVNERWLLSICIKDMYDECDGEPGWIEDLKQDSSFQRLSVDVPKKTVTWAIKRIASDKMAARTREPLSIACEMARQELDFPEQGLETLHRYYTTGNELIKKTRKKPKQKG